MKTTCLKTAVALFSLFALSACVDNDYDLSKDVDATISIGGSDFAIPGGKTEAIKLSKILKVHEGDLVKIDASGDYYLEKDGDPTTSDVKVNSFVINEPSIDPLSQKVTFESASPSARRRADANTLSTTFPKDVCYTSYQFSETNLPKEIKSMSRIDMDVTAKVKFSFSPSFVQNIYMDDVTITLPSYFISSDNMETGNVRRIKGKTIPKDGSYTETIHITGIDMSKLPSGEGFNASKLSLLISGKVVMNGTMHVNKNEILESVSMANIRMDVTLSDIKVNGMKGKVSPDITMSPNPISLSNIPDYLTDDEVVLDAANPMVFFSTTNGSPVPIHASGTFTAYDKSNKTLASVNFDIPSITNNKSEKFCLSPADPKITGVTHISVPTLPSLIKKIPDHVGIKITAVSVDKESELKLGSTYSVKTDYQVKVPFVFGTGLSIVYKDTVNNWNDDIKKLDVQQLFLTATAINNIPLDLIASGTPIDANGNVIKGISVVVTVPAQGTDNTVKANATSDINIVLTQSVAGSIKKLDGLILRIQSKASSTTSAAGRKLNSNQTFQLQNVKLKVPGGININLN